MLFYKLLLTRFIGMFLVLILGACSYQTFVPSNNTVEPSQATAIWEAVATQTAQFGRTGTTTTGSGTPAATSAIRTPGMPAASTPAATFSAATALPGGSGTPQAPAGAAEGPPPVVVQARQWLAQQIDEPLDMVVIQRFEQAQWPDSCLGLGQAGASCAQVITPGWRIVLYVNGQNYEVRTDANGQNFRMILGGKG